MSDYEMGGDDRLLAIPRLAERVGVTPRVLRYWEEQGLISPTREHGRLRYSPRDVAIARRIRTVLQAGTGIEGVRMLKRLAERDIRGRAAAGDEAALAEGALRILYQRKAFREETGMDEEHYPQGNPPPPSPPPRRGPPHGPKGPERASGTAWAGPSGHSGRSQRRGQDRCARDLRGLEPRTLIRSRGKAKYADHPDLPDRVD